MSTDGMRPVHPGEVLREEFLEPLGISVNALALALRVPASRLHAIVHQRRSVRPDTALRLGRYFGTTPEFWLNLQMQHDLRIAAREHAAEIEREVDPRAA